MMEKIDQKELARYLRDEHSKKANEILSAVKDDLRTEQGQLLLRVLGLLIKANAVKYSTDLNKQRSQSADSRNNKNAFSSRVELN